MAGPKNYDIKTKSLLVGNTIATAAFLGLGAAPVGMKRYVTLIRVNNVATEQNTLYVGSAVGSAGLKAMSTVTLVSAAQKWSHRLNVDDTEEWKAPDYEHPLFSFAASSYINMLSSKGNNRVFMQYYDQ